MKIKRFLAPDMRTALQHVRQEHGPDAVILSNRVTPEGVEIVAASQYDEDQVREHATPMPNIVASTELPPPAPREPAADAARAPENASTDAVAAMAPADIPASPSAPLPVAELDAIDDRPAFAESAPEAAEDTTVAAVPEPATPASPDPAPVAATPAIPAPVATAATPASAATPIAATEPAAIMPVTAPAAADPVAPWSALHAELAQMRQLLDRSLSQITDERLRSSPARQLVLDRLEEHGFSPALSRDIALAIAADTAPQHVCADVLDLLAQRLPLASDDLLDAGGALALIGPSGAGKTTTIGKLAARYSARHGVRDIALVSIDTTRPGGNDRLYALGRQLGIVVHEADSADSLKALLQRLSDYRLVLIDSAGFAPADPRSAEQLDWLNAANVRSLLVLAANIHPADLDAAVQRFQPAAPEGAVLTKLDETRELGSALSVLIAQALALTWVSVGQHLHDDLAWGKDADLFARLPALHRAPDNMPYDPVAALVAHHAFA